VVFDDGASHEGGDILQVTLGACQRLGHLRPLLLPGGEAAVRAPWRLAAAALVDAGEPVDLVASPQIDVHLGGLRREPTLSPPSHSAGRWFDAAAALCGLRAIISYPGQAAAELEALAAACDLPAYPFALVGGAPFAIDLRPTVRAMAADLRARVPVPVVAGRFQETMAVAAAAGCLRAVAAGAPPLVVLSGGCFARRRLAERTTALLEGRGLTVLRHHRVPPGEGGLPLGQAAVATHQLRERGIR
jgi:hydrogenase maturation protein HypF